MSATTPQTDTIRDGCRPLDLTPVTVDAESLDELTPAYLRRFKAELRADGYTAAEVATTTHFAVDCSLTTQDTVDRVRKLVDAASFLGADAVSLTVESVVDETKVRPALNACAERARREGVDLDVEGAISLS